jgi:GTP-binding protein
MLCGKKELAKTSSKPGKTQLINHFVIDKKWYLVDLPGYGFASVSKAARETFEKMISNYLTKRTNLINVFVLVDSRLPLQVIDNEFMHWLGTNKIPFSIVFTKTDKLSTGELKKNLEKYEQDLRINWEEIPPVFITSAEKKTGKEDLLDYIIENCVYFKNS